MTGNCLKGSGSERERTPRSAWMIQWKISDREALELTLKDDVLSGRQAGGVHSEREDSRCQVRAMQELAGLCQQQDKNNNGETPAGDWLRATCQTF